MLVKQYQMAQQLTNLDPSGNARPEIYVAYCEEDTNFALEIIERIEREGLKCYEDEGIGCELENMCEGSRCCHIVLLIYTKHSLNDGLIKFLTIQALQHAIELKQFTLMFLIDNIDMKNLPKEVQLVPHVRTSEPDYLKKLMEKLKAPNPSMDDLLPVGNISLALVWSFYYGYLKLILSAIPGKIDEWVSRNPSKSECIIPKRLYILLPTDANCYRSLSEVDDSIEFVETIETLQTDRAGNKGRKYKNTIYKICKLDKEYYVVAEYATPLKTMTEIKNGQLAGLTESALGKHVDLFKEKLSEILKQAQAENCFTLVSCDNGQLLSDLLVKEIENDLHEIEIAKCLPTTDLEVSHGISNLDPSGNARPEICVAYCEEDTNFALEIIERIEREGLKCYEDKGIGCELENMCEGSHYCRIVLLIYTKHSLKAGLIRFLSIHALQRTVELKQLSLMFLLDNIDTKNLPKEVQLVPHVRTSEPDYLNKLMEKLKAPNLSMDRLLPVGYIAPGLAWSFYYGYLKLILSAIPGKIDEWVSRNPSKSECIIPKRLYILLPTDANCYRSLSEVDDSIEFVETIETLQTDRAGNKGRKYKNTIYKICKLDKEYYVVAEYAIPLRTMSEMESGQLTGLTKSALRKQVDLFKKKLSEILKHKDCPDNCCTLVICDKGQSLSDLLVKEIENELREIEIEKACQNYKLPEIQQSGTNQSVVLRCLIQ